MLKNKCADSACNKRNHPRLLHRHDLPLVQHLHRVVSEAEVVQQDDADFRFGEKHLEESSLGLMYKIPKSHHLSVQHSGPVTFFYLEMTGSIPASTGNKDDGAISA